MSNPINGTAVNFGFGAGAGITIAEMSGVLLQSAEHGTAADVETVRDGLGAEVSHGWHNASDSATLEWVIKPVDGQTSLAKAIENTVNTYLTPGLFLTLTCTNMPSLNASVWEVQPGTRISGSNTTAKKISVPLRRLAGVTAVASA